MVAVLQFPATPRGQSTRLTRIGGEADIPWAVSLARRRYPGHYDFAAGEDWFRSVVFKNPHLYHACRTDHAFMITLLSANPWRPRDLEATVVMFCAEKKRVWDVIALARASLAWAKLSGCGLWAIHTDLERDITPIIDWLGVVKHSIRYVAHLR